MPERVNFYFRQGKEYFDFDVQIHLHRSTLKRSTEVLGYTYLLTQITLVVIRQK